MSCLTSEMIKRVEILAANNRFKHGSASPKFVFAAFMKEFKHTVGKDKIKECMQEIERICERINALSPEDLKKLVEVEENKEEEKELTLEEMIENLKDLPNVGSGVKTRFEPSPSGPLHLGHVFPLLLNFAYALKYKGEFVLRIADTNPKNILPEAYDMIVEDVEYLTGKLFEPVIQSARMPLYYEVGEELIRRGFAYVCTCNSEAFKQYVASKNPCPHRNQSVEENLEMWDKMLKGEFEEGSAVLRIKTSLEHPNPAIREWVAFRIVKEPHPLQGNKYVVYPTMNLSVPVDDHLLGITHVIRGKDHEVNTLRQMYVYDYMDWETPEFIHIGRINFEDLKLSTTQTKELINKGVYEGWDDVRLPTVRAFKKRGYRSEAFMRWVLSIGLTKRDKKTSYEEFMKNLVKIHRVLIDKEAKRLFFVKDPLKVEIVNLDKPFKATLPYHPDVKEYGDRVLYFDPNHPYVFLEKEEWLSLNEGDVVRLKHAFNIRKVRDNKAEIVRDSYKQVVHYVPFHSHVEASVVAPHKTFNGYVESNVLSLPLEQIVQFERFGFAKLHEITEGKVLFYYTHD